MQKNKLLVTALLVFTCFSQPVVALSDKGIAVLHAQEDAAATDGRAAVTDVGAVAAIQSWVGDWLGSELYNRLLASPTYVFVEGWLVSLWEEHSDSRP